MRLPPLALALTACLHAPGGLTITASPAEAEQIRGVLSAAVTVTGDPSGRLRGDLGIRVVNTRPDLFQYCVPDDSRTVGCNYESGRGFVVVVLAEGLVPFAAHEFCHLGLGTYNETEAAACALRVEEHYKWH